MHKFEPGHCCKLIPARSLKSPEKKGEREREKEGGREREERERDSE